MDWLKNVLKVEDNTSKPHNIRGIFSQCGEIPILHPFDTGTIGDAHYFLQFQTAQCAERALNLKLDIPDIRVCHVHQAPHLIDQYRGANPSAFNPLPSSSTALANGTRKLSNNGLIPAILKQKKSHTAVLGLSLMDRLDVAGKPSLSHEIHFLPPSHKFSSHNSTNESFKGAASTTQSFKPRSALLPLKATSSSLCQPPSTPGFNPTSLLVTSPDSTPPKSTFSFSLETRITMELFGQAIVYDLRFLEAEPRGIIEVLKLTCSERGAWMVVGAYYRRMGNPSAAIVVINAMLEVMATEGVSEDKLKFAYLLLSGCEADLARTTKSENKDASEKHAETAQAWLQKVYSVSHGLPSLRWSSHHVASFVSIPNIDAKGVNNSSQPRKCDASTQTKILPPSYTKPILEREIRSLRDRFNDQAIQLSELRSAKRKLVDDNSYERDLRRKLQKRLDEAQKERDMAQKMEDYALQQCKREVASRRMAEEKVEREHQMRVELLKLAEKKVGREPLSEGLANVTRKYAFGDENTQP